MQGFIDETVIVVSSGNGGAGCVSFRREKYVARGGPDGGDGGHGGAIIFRVKENLKTLSELHMKRVFRAQSGRPGEGRKKHGKDGEDAIIHVPPGTIIRDAETNDLIYDLKDRVEDWVYLEGGKGGKGNAQFATSRKQAPRYAQKGIAGEERQLRIELQIIADIGFVGFPNAGKSSLLNALTNAHPKIAAYPFTTKIPNLGVMNADYQDIILADIPGIIEGASQGAGLGYRFLKHISRTKALAFLIDLSDESMLNAFDVLLEELKTYGHGLAKKRRVILGSKMDVDNAEELLAELKKRLPDEQVYGISSFSRYGFEDLKGIFSRLIS
jgi:GTP-binding protein